MLSHGQILLRQPMLAAIATRHARGFTSTRLAPSTNSESDQVELGQVSIVDLAKVAFQHELDKPNYTKLPRLAHNLDRVLFNPGVHQLQDTRTKVYNFDPWLKAIPSMDEFDHDKLRPFVKPSEDATLHKKARKMNAKYAGSTSSLTGLLSQLYFLISGWRPVSTQMLSQRFTKLPTHFTRGSRFPASVYLRYKANRDIYTVDADKVFDEDENILQILGRPMEKFLTLPKVQFKKFLKASKSGKETDREVYTYNRIGSLLMRSQLDCYDPRLPGKAFDLKTRATIAIRLLLSDLSDATGYEIKRSKGVLESFEREYYDLIRAAFLKYNMQARIGGMDGIFVAYHNTRKLFGFEYIPLEEIDRCIFGSTRKARDYFLYCVRLLNILFDTIAQKYPKQTTLVSFENRRNRSSMLIYVEAIPQGQDNSRLTLENDLVVVPESTEVTMYKVDQYQSQHSIALDEVQPDRAETIHAEYRIEELDISPADKRDRYRAFRQRQHEWFDDNAERRDAKAAGFAEELLVQMDDDDTPNTFKALLKEISARHALQAKDDVEPAVKEVWWPRHRVSSPAHK
ncbi:hypothetical protein H4R34_004270 [Dimargaris verticillata]|uniref:Mitochondrial protein Pet127-domain-containing protein n=1 Tax=Dimargaris verticillata TaxID=2761393 RepID=A0A9W8E8A8_9FUNG|nr:hypothetical protein H4R34_004270 [Dimargaris verticillata]